jgi:P4 family phage/plasmid primase-like protien
VNSRTLTVGRVYNNPIGERVTLDPADPVGAFLRIVRGNSPGDRERWYIPAVFQGDRRLDERWEGACAVGVDADWHGDRGTHGEVAVPPSAICRIHEKMVADLDLPCTAWHPTPHGARFLFLLDRMTSDKAAWARASQGAHELVRRKLEALSLLGARNGFEIDGAGLEPNRIFWAARTTCNRGHRRDAPVYSVRKVTAFTLEELAAFAPAEGTPKPRTRAAADGRHRPGHRHPYLKHLVSRLALSGVHGEDLHAWTLEENQLRCDPPLPEQEVAELVAWADKLEGDGASRPLTDLGNAERLVDLHGEDLRFAPGIGWLVWDGRRFKRDEDGEVVRRAAATVRALYREAATIEDQAVREATAGWARKSESASRLNAMVTLAESRPEIVVAPDELDADPWLLNVENGTLDLRTGELRPHSREDLITKLAPVLSDPAATCPRFDRFLSEITRGNSELVAFHRRLAGYTLTGSVREHVLPFLYGGGRNGKTTYVSTLQAMLGDYAAAAPSGLLLGERDEADPRSGVAQLHGRRFVAVTESSQGRRLNEELVKKLTGADRRRASYLYRDSFEYAPTDKIWLQGNHKPEIRGTDPAIWARILLVPFLVSFEGREDRDLAEKLAAELPGILSWALAGCLEWQRDGLRPPVTVREATRGYRREMDRLLAFLETRCQFEEGAFTPTPTLKGAYAAWALEAEEDALPWNAIIPRLRERGCTPARRTVEGTVTRGWEGIRLKTPKELTAELFEEVRREA